MGLTVLDAGVVIAVLDASDAHHAAATAALHLARDRDDRFAIAASAYAEVLVGPLRRTVAGADHVDAFLDALPATIEPATRAVARQAAILRATHAGRLRLPDALVVATGLVLGADRIVTTDTRWPQVGIEVEVIGSSGR